LFLNYDLSNPAINGGDASTNSYAGFSPIGYAAVKSLIGIIGLKPVKSKGLTNPDPEAVGMGLSKISPIYS
jgi:hypothetical protein